MDNPTPAVNTVKPLGRRIVVERIIATEEKDQMKGGIIIPSRYVEQNQDDFIRAKIIELGTAPKFEVEVGQIVLINRNVGFPTGVENHVVILEHDCLCILEEIPEEAAVAP